MGEPGAGPPAEDAARALVNGLAAAGVRHVCITPGSRSTPLTVAFARCGSVRAWLHLDERSSSFFALGLAKATGEPVALVCTSGTAAANFLPAVVEANLTRIPLIVVTADRPARLRDVGADQTIDQVRMFGSNARWNLDIPAPTGTAFEAGFYMTVAARAVRESLAPLPGPVHLNVSFEEPLIGLPGAPATGDAVLRVRPAGETGGTPAPIARDIERAARLLGQAERPIIVAGPETGGLPAREITALADALGAPILADPLSGLRTGDHDLSHVMTAYDALVRDPRANRLLPDAVLRFGAPPTSKALNQFLVGAKDAVHVLCDGWGSWRDPWGLTTAVVSGDAATAAAGLADALCRKAAGGTWTAEWGSRDRSAADAMRKAAVSLGPGFEGRVFVELQDSLPSGATLFAGNSMPVRDLDSFWMAGAKPLRLLANRGANGIDGVVSTALGAAAVTAGPTVLVIGDLSFYHDMNGLWAARRHGVDLTVVLVNNNGGGIFHYLPQAAHPDVFEDWFGTPGDIEFAPVVEMYGGTHELLGDWAQLQTAVREPGTGLRVIEVRTDRAANAEMHRVAWARAAAAAWDG